MTWLTRSSAGPKPRPGRNLCDHRKPGSAHESWTDETSASYQSEQVDAWRLTSPIVYELSHGAWSPILRLSLLTAFTVFREAILDNPSKTAARARVVAWGDYIGIREGLAEWRCPRER